MKTLTSLVIFPLAFLILLLSNFSLLADTKSLNKSNTSHSLSAFFKNQTASINSDLDTYTQMVGE
jgi:hypothetical protein